LTHDVEPTSAAYLAGELPDDEGKEFERHLLECDECWAEIDKARRGLVAVESLREPVPAHLRAAVRRRIGATPIAPTPHRHRVALAVAAGLAVVAGTTAGAILLRRPGESAVITSAVGGYLSDELPGAAMPKTPAPDLSRLRMTDMGAGAGTLDGMPVTAYAYRDDTGRRLTVYVGTTAFPMSRSAHMFHGRSGPWMSHHDGVAVLCARRPHRVLIVGEDDTLVMAAAEALDVM
jgi:anti-sigma factor RsiW